MILSTIADALGYHEFGITGWSEGGPWALAAAAYIDPGRLRHVSAIAGGCYGAFGDNWAKDHLSKVDAMGGFLALHFKPGFQLMYELLALTAEHFRSNYFKQLLQAVNEYDRQISCGPVSKRCSVRRVLNASPKEVMDLSLILSCFIRHGSSMSDRFIDACTFGKDWTTDWCLTSLTSRFLSRCQVQFGML